MIVLLAALSFAIDPVAYGDAPEIVLPSEDPVEIVVYGESVLRETRLRLVDSIESEGYVQGRHRRGETVFRPKQNWRGRMFLADDGTVRFGRPIIAADAGRTEPEPYDPFTKMSPAPSATTSGRVTLLPSAMVLQSRNDRVLRDIQIPLQTWRDARAATQFDEALTALPTRLDALWNEGKGLDGHDAPTWEMRKAQVLDLWATRTDTTEGEAIRRTIEAWLIATVQPSEHPLTLDEILSAEANAGGRDLALDVTRLERY